MYLFDEFNALQLLKSFNTFCATHPFCKSCPLFVNRTGNCAFQSFAKDRLEWQNNLEGRICERLEEYDEK